MVYHVIDPQTRRDLYAVDLEYVRDTLRTVGPPRPLVKAPFDEAMPDLSPDGRFVAYHANRTGRWEVYITRFPDGRGEWAVSTGGGNLAYLSGKGDEIFFADPKGNLMSVPVDLSGEEPKVGRPVALFNAAPYGHGLINGFHNSFYYPRPDGQAFAIVRFQSPDDPPAMTVVENWYREFARE